MTERSATHVRSFYEAIDGDDYERLRSLLGEEFVHDRPDRVLDGPDEFVRFMREDRPITETTHEIDGIYHHEADADAAVAVQGRLVRNENGETLFSFIDVHTITNGCTARLRTYTD